MKARPPEGQEHGQWSKPLWARRFRPFRPAAGRSVPAGARSEPFCHSRCTIPTRAESLRELTRLFTKLGVVGFGGPAAHVALMREEVVRRRGWMGDDEFLDLVGAVNLLPGPNSTELALHIGRRQAGTAGLLVAGFCFIVPATLLVLGCAWAYVRYGKLPAVAGAWTGAQPVVLAVVAVALVGFARTAVRSVTVGAAGAVALALAVLGTPELLVLLVAGLIVLGVRRPPAGAAAGFGGAVLVAWSPGWSSAAAAAPGLAWLFAYFFKIGAVLYGSGYVLLSFLHRGLVERGGYLTQAQLLDAIAAGQLTPGPVFTTATFVGYLLRGTAFLLVGVGGALVPWLRRTPPARAFLDGVDSGSVALMAVVTGQLGRAALVSPLMWLLALASLALLRAGVNSAWLIGGGALLGLLLR